MGQHGGLASDRAEALLEDLGDFALPVRQVLLTVEDSQDDVAQS